MHKVGWSMDAVKGLIGVVGSFACLVYFTVTVIIPYWRDALAVVEAFALLGAITLGVAMIYGGLEYLEVIITALCRLVAREMRDMRK